MELEQKFAYGVEVLLPTPDSFNILRESLTRIGVASKKSKTLYQSSHVLHKRGRYFILHFLELFRLDGRTADISEDDYRRRNTIAKLVSQWGICKLVYNEDIEFTVPVSEIKIIPYKEKKDWVLVSKYTVGGRK